MSLRTHYDVTVMTTHCIISQNHAHGSCPFLFCCGLGQVEFTYVGTRVVMRLSLASDTNITIQTGRQITSLQWRHNERDGVSNHQCIGFFCSTVCSGADQRKHQSSASLAFVRGIHRWPVNSPHKGPVTRKMFPFDDVIMWTNYN